MKQSEAKLAETPIGQPAKVPRLKPMTHQPSVSLESPPQTPREPPQTPSEPSPQLAASEARPAGWEQASDGQGNVYYYNTAVSYTHLRAHET